MKYAYKASKQKEALSLKAGNIPESLFKYRSLNNLYDLENIRTNQFYLSPPKDMNDPYESDFIMDGKFMRKHTYKNGDIFKVVDFRAYLTEDQIEHLKIADDPHQVFLQYLGEKFPNEKDKLPKIAEVLENIADKIGDEMNEWFSEFIKEGIKFCCFSERNDSTLMWSHYANKHTGICVEYDFRNYHLKNSLYPVVYDDRMADITPLFIDKNLNYLIPILAISQKAKDWNYEQEWRLAITHGILEGNLVYSPKPVRIFLGINISEENKRIMTEIREEMDIEIIQMRKNTGSFKITSK